MKKQSSVENPHIGSSFDDFLEEEGIKEEVTAIANERVMAWQLQQAMKEKDLSQEATVQCLPNYTQINPLIYQPPRIIDGKQ